MIQVNLGNCREGRKSCCQATNNWKYSCASFFFFLLRVLSTWTIDVRSPLSAVWLPHHNLAHWCHINGQCAKIRVWICGFEQKCVFNCVCVHGFGLLGFFSVCGIQQRRACACLCVFWLSHGGSGRPGCAGLSLDEVEERTWEPSLLLTHLLVLVELQEVLNVWVFVCVFPYLPVHACVTLCP